MFALLTGRARTQKHTHLTTCDELHQTSVTSLAIASTSHCADSLRHMPIMLEESEALLIGSFGCRCRPCGAAQGFTGGSARKRLGAVGFLRAALVVRPSE